ncbi:hypothetical protein C8J57DRAFT_1257553 [Mycena rebaudengoi]|nr:hypothetical protein C8J57DRAFT_1257553 [Mycena rebaudengoi]
MTRCLQLLPPPIEIGRYNDEEEKQTSSTLAAAGGCLWKDIYVVAAAWMVSLKGPRDFPGTETGRLWPEVGMRSLKTRGIEKCVGWLWPTVRKEDRLRTTAPAPRNTNAP